MPRDCDDVKNAIFQLDEKLDKIWFRKFYILSVRMCTKTWSTIIFFFTKEKANLKSVDKFQHVLNYLKNKNMEENEEKTKIVVFRTLFGALKKYSFFLLSLQKKSKRLYKFYCLNLCFKTAKKRDS